MKYQWKWMRFPWRWWLAIYKGTLRAFGDDSKWGRTWVSMPRVPPDTARRALARRWLMSGEPVTGVLAWDRDMRKAVR